MRIGYFRSCEEYSPSKLIDPGGRAEEAGFDALWISDHFHPWKDEQGQSPFVWSMIGAISQVCALPVTTAVTCPTMRIHPMVIAHAAAISAVLLEGRFVLGIGTGEALNSGPGRSSPIEAPTSPSTPPGSTPCQIRGHPLKSRASG